MDIPTQDGLFTDEEAPKSDSGRPLSRADLARHNYEPYWGSATRIRSVGQSGKARSELHGSVASGTADRTETIDSAAGREKEIGSDRPRTTGSASEANATSGAAMGLSGMAEARGAALCEPTGVGTCGGRWAYLQCVAARRSLGPLHGRIDDPFEESFAEEAWSKLLRQYDRTGERDAYLYDNRDDPEWETLAARAQKSAERFGMLRDELIEWAGVSADTFLEFWEEVILARMAEAAA